jgi:hypothetical protein
MFRRRKEEETPAEDAVVDETSEESAAEVTDAEPEPARPGTTVLPRPEGPWDEAETPDDGFERLDLGGLRVVVIDGVELRVDLDEQQQVVAARFLHGEDVMQIGVYAAPRTVGIWGEIAEEIAASLREQGGTAVEAEGPFGLELHATIPTVQQGVFVPARFIGVNGPRWFLRALVTGPSAASGQENPLLAQTLRSTVVVRGKDAMAPRDTLPLRLPEEAQAQAQAHLAAAAAAEAAASNGQAAPTIPERGPEITETR